MRQWNQHFEIMFGEEQLMGSWAFRSEQELATLVAKRVGACADRILIGGLGMGFTLAAARVAFPVAAQIEVAELVPTVVEWAQGPLAHLFDGSLSDPRVTITVGDVHDVIIERESRFDAILLDVDNGPDGLISCANERLYCPWGLRAAHAALKPGGVLAVWSAYADDDFTVRLRTAGFVVEQVSVDGGEQIESPPHILWLAAKAA
ncbi:spermidine synthase [Sphingomonas guangdongensis]|uniref:spermidine synthase n=1 Tax=Sphingomonas guangdongensis TaxID=1141890 RepID=UPI001FEA2519|nr:spermidine synthase [Sphingomonas guangdongensis]